MLNREVALVDDRQVGKDNVGSEEVDAHAARRRANVLAEAVGASGLGEIQALRVGEEERHQVRHAQLCTVRAHDQARDRYAVVVAIEQRLDGFDQLPQQHGRAAHAHEVRRRNAHADQQRVRFGIELEVGDLLELL